MNQVFSPVHSWYHALTLSERMASLGSVQGSGHVLAQAELNGHAELAERRLARWRSQHPFATADYFAQRLASDEMDEEAFLYLLGEPIEWVRERVIQSHQSYKTQPWLGKIAKIEKAFSRPAGRALSFGQTSDGQEMVRFLKVVEPLIGQALARLRGGIWVLSRTYSRNQRPFNPKTIEQVLFASLPDQLLTMLSRTMVLELNVARVQGLLTGETVQERFQSFIERLQDREVALALLEEYPVLTRQVLISLEQWVKFKLEFLRHLCADWKKIRATFCPDKAPGVLVELTGGGDQHGDGQAVLIAKFSSGFQLVYKPKPLAVDVHFQALLAWLNARGNHPPFRTLKVLNRGAYGWVEFVKAQTCHESEQVERFYERQGGYLALLYALQATDFHFENLIASGEHPVLIDLESLFHAQAGQMTSTHSDMLAGQTMAYSVLRVGLLPQRLWASEESDGIEMSGLGGMAGQLSPSAMPYFELGGTDEMRMARKRMPMAGANNRPTLQGAEINVLAYSEAIIRGFSNIYHLLCSHRDELLAQGGPFARFANDEVRIILRPTHLYALLLQESFHPDVLRNALDRDRLFDKLWVAVEHQPYLSRVIPAEREDLWRGDIPIFTTRPNSRDLFSSKHEPIADFFEQTGIELVADRLAQLGARDLERQLWFIRASFTTLAMEMGHTAWRSYRLTAPTKPATAAELLSAACAIGDKLDMLALRGADGDATWIGLTLIAEKHWTLVPMGPDLYSGIAGVALFLAYLGQMTNESRYDTLARAALTTMRRQIEQSRQYLTSIGGFSGWGSIIYTFTHLSVLWNETALLTEASALVELLPPLIEADEQFDIVGGAAGCLAALLALYRVQPSSRTLEVATICAEHLLTHAQPQEEGIGWLSKGIGDQPLAGFSHGGAGIAAMLLELSSLTGETGNKARYHQAAQAAISYEQSLFDAQAGNWRDLRGPVDEHEHEATHQEPKFMCAWCHGAPGIGLARLRSLPYLGSEARADIRAELSDALKTTLTQGFGMNHSLCHGDLGNLELLLQASQRLSDPRWAKQTQRLTAIILESIKQHGWLCGVPLGVETPGLMTGLAGIGYGLLRLAAPERVPSVLTLEPPINVQSNVS